ncbi:hypothetical protein [Rhizobium pisi]
MLYLFVFSAFPGKVAWHFAGIALQSKTDRGNPGQGQIRPGNAEARKYRRTAPDRNIRARQQALNRWVHQQK